MKRIISLVLILAGLICGAALAVRYLSSHPTPDNENDMKSFPMRIRLGDPKDSDLGGQGSSTDNHPSGLTFYQREWQRGSLGTVEFVHGKHSFTIDNVLSVLGTDDRDIAEGIYQWSISFGVSPEQADTHEAALARMTKLFSDLRARGWMRFIQSSQPRLTGQKAWNYIEHNPVYSLDPD